MLMQRILLFGSVILLTVLFASCGSNDTPKSSAVGEALSGEDIYKSKCVSCHMSGGDGIANVYPPLAGSDYLANREQTILQVLKGSSGEITVNGKTYNNTMPPQNLSDDETAAVLTYVYSNMGNTGAAVTADEVKAVREKM